jgi:post-segregation antitoxin (ccd killing protein)
MEIKINVPDSLLRQARALGLSIEIYVEELLAEHIRRAAGQQNLESVRAAVAQIRELRKGNKLGGLRIKDLTHPIHKY